DIGEYLTALEKIELLKNHKSVKNMSLKSISIDRNGDWINQRDQDYEKFDYIEDFFNIRAIGVSTNRDAWVYNFSKDQAILNTKKMVENYNSELKRLASVSDKKQKDLMLN